MPNTKTGLNPKKMILYRYIDEKESIISFLWSTKWLIWKSVTLDQVSWIDKMCLELIGKLLPPQELVQRSLKEENALGEYEFAFVIENSGTKLHIMLIKLI